MMLLDLAVLCLNLCGAAFGVVHMHVNQLFRLDDGCDFHEVFC